MTYLPAGIRTFLAALFGFRDDKLNAKIISFLGDTSLKNIVITFAPVATFPIVGLPCNN
jgi:hypothetical protein